MVCRNEEQCLLIRWDDKIIYGFVAEPTEYQKKLLNAVNKLPIVCRKVVILYAFEGIQRQEIAAMMETSLAAIRFLIYRGGLLLHEHMSESNGFIEKADIFRDIELKTAFSGWPYAEYAKLTELRKNMVFVESIFSNYKL